MDMMDKYMLRSLNINKVQKKMLNVLKWVFVIQRKVNVLVWKVMDLVMGQPMHKERGKY